MIFDMKKPKTTRNRNGIWEARFAGKVAWDSKGKTPAGFPNRRIRTIAIWAPADTVDDDCGPGTDLIQNLLKHKVERMGRKNVVVQESWRC